MATDVQYWLSSVLTSATAALLCFATSGRAEWHVARRTERGAAVNWSNAKRKLERRPVQRVMGVRAHVVYVRGLLEGDGLETAVDGGAVRRAVEQGTVG
jgi:hypothetical protein